MKNREFNVTLRRLPGCPQGRWTVAKQAGELMTGRAHLTGVLGNLPGRGGQTRWKVVTLFKRRWPEQAPALLAVLGWTSEGGLATFKDQPPNCSTGNKKVAVETFSPGL
jgi:hypothetical protein